MNVLIADDEQVARQRLRRLLSALADQTVDQTVGDVVVVGECKSGEEVLARVRQGGIDVLLLDIHMPGLTGLETLQALPEPVPYVIFCTAHAEHAIAAFEAGAIDYVLKPVTGPRLEKALARAQSRDQVAQFHAAVAALRAASAGSAGSPGSAGSDRLAIPGKQGITLVDPESVSHAVLEGELVTLVTGSGKLFSDFSLQELEGRLPRDRFIRVHRKAVVNLHRVVRLEPAETGGFYALMQNGERVEVSRQAARELKRRLGIARALPDAPGDASGE